MTPLRRGFGPPPEGFGPQGGGQAGPPRIADIQRAVAAAAGIDVADMLSERRARRVARPRQLAMWMAAKLTGYSTPRIGMMFARDHTTVLHALRCVNERMAAADPDTVALHATAAAVLARLCSAAPPAPPPASTHLSPAEADELADLVGACIAVLLADMLRRPRAQLAELRGLIE